MYIAEVTPFSKSMKSNTLSYFSGQKVAPGSIVTIPLRNKNIKGLVISTQKVENLKSEIKSSKYALKKIAGISKNTLFSDDFLHAAESTANYFATSTGSIIQSTIPNLIFEDISKIHVAKIKSPKNNTKPNIKSQKYIIQSEDHDRYSEYKSIIRENFAKGKSVLFLSPTTEDVNYAYDELSRGIDKHTFVFHSKKTRVNIIKKWNELITRDKPSLIIATPGFIGVPVNDLGIIICERETSAAWKTIQRPYFDMRYFAEKYAEKLHSSFLLGDLMLRTETLLRYDNSEFFEYSTIKFRSITDAKQSIINLKDENQIRLNEKTGKPDKEKIISGSLAQLIIENQEENNHMFIYNQRKGLSPIIICGDCGQIVKCNECESPIVLYGKDATEKHNFFKCHTCQTTRYAGEVCKNCGGWRLVSLGSGTTKIRDEILKIAPKAKVFILDKDHASTQNRAQKIIKDFYESASGILIGTEMALLYMHDHVENVAIANIDGMFSLPDFRIKERITNILLKARSKATQNFMIQTRNSEEMIFQNVRDGNLSDFYRQEFINRKQFNYPPFSLIVKLSISGRAPKKIEEEFNEIKETMQPTEMLIYPSMIQRGKGMKTYNGIMRFERSEWPISEIVEKLRNLPPQVKIEVDAENIL
jgi:primosomal protein N' (replication factor Y)